jgi:hypothetical protein
MKSFVKNIFPVCFKDIAMTFYDADCVFNMI